MPKRSYGDGSRGGEFEAIQVIINELLLRAADFLLSGEYEDALGEGLGYFYGLENDASYSLIPAQEMTFLGWLLLDCYDDNDRLIMDDFIDVYSDVLRSEEMRICYGLKDTYLTCLCIKKRTQTTYFLKDIFLGDEIAVPIDYFGADNIPVGSVVYTRIMKLANEFFLVGAGLLLEKKRVKKLVEYTRDKYKDYCDVEEKMSFRTFLKRNGELLFWWMKGIEEPQLPPPTDEED